MQGPALQHNRLHTVRRHIQSIAPHDHLFPPISAPQSVRPRPSPAFPRTNPISCPTSRVFRDTLFAGRLLFKLP
jgi:hypothetical protein